MARQTAELEEEKARSADPPTPERSRSLIRRLFAGGQTSAAKEQNDRRDELEKGLQSLQGEVSEQQKVLKSIDQLSPASPVAENWRTLESLQARIKELESERLEKIQLVKERVAFTASMADAISNVHNL